MAKSASNYTSLWFITRFTQINPFNRIPVAAQHNNVASSTPKNLQVELNKESFKPQLEYTLLNDQNDWKSKHKQSKRKKNGSFHCGNRERLRGNLKHIAVNGKWVKDNVGQNWKASKESSLISHCKRTSIWMGARKGE